MAVHASPYLTAGRSLRCWTSLCRTGSVTLSALLRTSANQASTMVLAAAPGVLVLSHVAAVSKALAAVLAVRTMASASLT